jgi:hypothetical protein
MILVWVVVVVLVLGALVALGTMQGGGSSGYLEWDPEERVAWLGDQEDADLVEMLELHNADRRKRGLDPVTLDDFRDQVRRGS